MVGLLISTRLSYVAVSLYMHFVTKADGWTLHFPLATTGVTCFHSGLLFWQIRATMLFSVAAISTCILAKNTIATGLQQLALHFCFLLVSYSTIYQQAAMALSSWLGLQFVERRQAAMKRTIQELLPKDIVEMAISLSTPLPFTFFFESECCFLHLDLRDYTGLMDSEGPQGTAALMDAIFCSFDVCVRELGAQSKVFKVDTVGDAYEAAAFFSSGADEREDGGRKADICASVDRIARAFIAIVTSLGKAKGKKLSCRVGVASGWVVAGMLGKLQPRFHLLGDPVYLSQKLESEAALNTVKVCPAVQSLLAASQRV